MEKELLEAAALLRSVNPELSKTLESYAGIHHQKPDLSSTDKDTLRYLKKRVRVRLTGGAKEYNQLPIKSWVIAIEDREKELGVGQVKKAAKPLNGEN
jgi:hypothetical protein